MRVDTIDASLAPGLAHDSSAPATTISIIQIDPEDSLDLLLAGVQKQSGPVIFLLPEHGQAFEQDEDFKRLHAMQELGMAPRDISFVIPPTRAEMLGRLALQQEFPFSSSLERAIALLYRPRQSDVHTILNLTQEEAPAFSQAHTTSGPLASPPQANASGEHELAGLGGVRMVPEQEAQGLQVSTTGPLPVAGQQAFSRKRRLRRGQLALIALVLVFVVGGCIWLLPNLLAQSSTLTAAPPSAVGQLFFANSGQLDPTSAQGLNDMVIIDLRSITPPASGNALYAWLRPDPGQDEVKPILLGQLAVKAGHAHLTYANPTHEDLLVTFSRFLVTEQDAKTVPVTPPLDSATWRYQATIPTIPNPADEQHHYTVLDHLRHLLARDPTVASIGLAGGLNIWLYRNSLEVMEEATTARDYWQYRSSTPYMHRQIVRILDYLDGYNYALRDVPLIDPITHSESAFLIDRKYGELGLLTLEQQQQPPGYLAHISIHLEGVAYSPGATPAQVALVKQIDTVITQVLTPLFKRVHDDAAQLVKMDQSQLQTSSALDLLNDMSTNANAAVAGAIDPVTGSVGKGATWIHAQMGQLAVVTVTRSASAS
jgi:hypothetical protein